MKCFSVDVCIYSIFKIIIINVCIYSTCAAFFPCFFGGWGGGVGVKWMLLLIMYSAASS